MTVPVADAFADHYAVVGLLGRGGMGEVHRVRHLGWGIDLAMKSALPGVLHDAAARESFVREAEAWVTLDPHPNVVACHYVRMIEGVPRIFAEYVAGSDLEQWIGEGRLYQGSQESVLARILDFAIQAAWGLAAAHGQGLVHQDVKPSNMMVAGDDTLKVTDFGLAKARAVATRAVAPSQAGQASDAGVVTYRGMTPAYCSPEQFRRERVTRQTDVWSWAVGVLEMFCGGISWISGHIAAEALEAFLSDPDPQYPAMPVGVTHLLSQCFAPDPEERPQGMIAVADALKDVYQRELGRAYPRAYRPTVRSLGDVLNNRALSLVDLDRPAEAEQTWRKALATEPHHLPTLYNSGIWHWRRGGLTDETILQQLDAAADTDPDGWVAGYLKCLVLLESGDLGGARTQSTDVLDLAPTADAEELRNRLARADPGPVTPYFPAFSDHVLSAAWVADGSRVVVATDRTNSGSDISFLNPVTGDVTPLLTDTGHRGLIQGIALGESGDVLLTGGEDGTARWRDLVGGRSGVLRMDGAVHSVWLSPGSGMAIVASDTTVLVWNIARDRVMSETSVESYGLRVSQDCQTAVAFGHERALLWDPVTGEVLAEIPAGDSVIGAADISLDGTSALICHADGRFELWRTRPAQKLREWHGFRRKAEFAQLSPDGAYAFTSGNEDRLRLWDIAAGRCLRTFDEPLPGAARTIAWSPDGSMAFVGGVHGSAELRPGPSPTNPSPYWPSQLRFQIEASVAAERAAVLTADAERAWRTGDLAAALDAVREMRELPGHRLLPETTRAWRLLSESCEKTTLTGIRLVSTLGERTGRGWTHAVHVSPDGGTGFSANADGRVTRWDLEHAEQGSTRWITAPYLMRVTADGRYLLLMSRDGKAARLHILGTFEGHELNVRIPEAVEAYLSMDATRLITVAPTTPTGETSEGLAAMKFTRMPPVERITYQCTHGTPASTIQARDLTTGQTIWTRPLDLPATALALSRDETLTVACTYDTLLAWRTDTGDPLWQLHEPRADWSALATDATGSRILAAGANGTHLLDATNGSTLRTLPTTDWRVLSAALSPDGRIALTGDTHEQVRIWDLRNPGPEPVRRLRGLSMVDALALSDDCQTLVVGHSDGSLQLWAVDW
ncbi:WD40 repeat domain-containing serine/threonine protein kinase, partial [Catenulispora pinisilvae]|uniref:WD40 repeat domain-containing serine/threonine protein kinase n=1 Tax=Catenulispora pinisilvae TaxID=2705253 RepID=UPI001892452B